MKKPTKKRNIDCKVSPAERAAEASYKGEHLVVSNGRLFCEACRHPVQSTKSHRLKQHIQSQKHRDGKQRMESIRLKDQRLTAVLAEMQEERTV